MNLLGVYNPVGVKAYKKSVKYYSQYHPQMYDNYTKITKYMQQMDAYNRQKSKGWCATN
ncbi:hypothetical protein WUBG_10494 [Wuchereria bancrofti]|uniref:Uncharacterized protein n=1 Tax=Wuchereria bancrofti TaxID=6293 RepID=J9ENK4_WUCBA|nr:hypothetical protein WUBG_10494 [Wuchereria bancrofti]